MSAKIMQLKKKTKSMPQIEPATTQKQPRKPKDNHHRRYLVTIISQNLQRYTPFRHKIDGSIPAYFAVFYYFCRLYKE